MPHGHRRQQIPPRYPGIGDGYGRMLPILGAIASGDRASGRLGAARGIAQPVRPIEVPVAPGLEPLCVAGGILHSRTEPSGPIRRQLVLRHAPTSVTGWIELGMQFRHLRYFVEIVDAGSFSRAATTIHVAQPALSQQMAELEQRMGGSLLQRSTRGVRPTEAGEILYREAASILRRVERLPGIVRSSSGTVEGTVSVGIATMLSGTRTGLFLERCTSALPNVTMKLTNSDSESLKAGIEAGKLDLAIVFEDELRSTFWRKPLFRQRLYVISRRFDDHAGASISLADLADQPLALPSEPNDRRSVINRAFALAGVAPKIVAECRSLNTELSVVRTGVGGTIINTGNIADIGMSDSCRPLLLEPPLFMTCSVISSANVPLTHAGEGVKTQLIDFMQEHHGKSPPPGAEWMD